MICRVRRMSHNALSMGMIQQFLRFVPGDFDLWPWHSNSSERGTKHVFPVNLVQKKTKQAALKTEPCLHAVNSLKLNQKNAQNAKPKQCTKTKPKPTLTCKNYCIGAYHCAQLSYTTQHRTVLVLFPLILQTVRAQMMSTGGEDILWQERHPICRKPAPIISKIFSLGEPVSTWYNPPTHTHFGITATFCWVQFSR